LTTRAFELYKALFGQVEDLIEGTHLLIVPSGPLTQLPFQVLVSSLPKCIAAGVQSRVVTRLGAELKDLSGEDRERLSWKGNGGVRITKVLQGTAADGAGLNDGYLTASEIAGLKLDADWVILSACNTAAGGAQGAEALSGLARAFIYAQPRALLVSHWPVRSAATVKLITGAMKRLVANKAMGRAEAMRQLMLDLIDHGKPCESHPAYWAPFVVVGEGGALK
jgi:hypothetical protein